MTLESIYGRNFHQKWLTRFFIYVTVRDSDVYRWICPNKCFSQTYNTVKRAITFIIDQILIPDFWLIFLFRATVLHIVSLVSLSQWILSQNISFRNIYIMYFKNIDSWKVHVTLHECLSLRVYTYITHWLIWVWASIYL